MIGVGEQILDLWQVQHFQQLIPSDRDPNPVLDRTQVAQCMYAKVGADRNPGNGHRSVIISVGMR